MVELPKSEPGLFSEAYRRALADAGAVSERTTRYAPTPPTVRERIVRCIWFDQSLATDRLRCDNGTKLRVLSPGWWNLEAGPDFRNAALRIGHAGVVKGDVEVHLQASFWHAHGHDTDPAYNSVVLHVALWNDTGRSSVATAAGATVPQITLEPYLRTPLAELADSVDEEEYPEAGGASAGRCNALLAEGKVTLEWLEQFLGHAGDQRVADKARRLAGRAASGAAGNDDQLLYEAIAEGLGYKRNSAPALELARRLPIALLRERVGQRADGIPLPLAAEALLFGVSGLLPSSPPDADEAAREHTSQLRALWDQLGGGLADDALDPAQWSFDGTRPPNFPTRRIAALARVAARALDQGLHKAIRQALGPAGSQGSHLHLAHSGHVRNEDVTPAHGGHVPDEDVTPRLAPRELKVRRAQLLGFFLSLRDPFWDTRTHFAGKLLAHPLRLVGDDRADTLIIDGLLPALLYQARRDNDRAFEELLHQLFATYPKLPSTAITRFMSRRMFGREEREVKMLRSARRQQGLYQLYTDFCDSETATCTRCPLVRLLEG
ncbi:MAG: DUF2851 family protein [Planctomycetes bacterium]|nr:DUF2851 family protein [Planctomycetota bacterium]